LHVKAVLGVDAWLEASALEFGLDLGGVPVLDRVSDVVDFRRSARIARIAREQPRALVAEGEVALRFAVILLDSHPKQAAVKVARSGVVLHLKRDVVDGDRLEPLTLVREGRSRGGSAGRGGCCCQREALNELAARYLPALEIP